MRVLFIHRSVGKHLLKYGELRQRLSELNIQLDDFNSNDNRLTHNDSTTDSTVITMPGHNTNPDNLKAYFNGWDDNLNNYDLVMIKSCYPNNHIKSKAQLETIKNQYLSIIKNFNDHKKTLLILTSPPLRPIMTNQSEAQLSIELANWLVAQSSDNVHVFDFHKFLSESNGKHAGMLKATYRHWSMPWDCHPKAKAHRAIAPQLVDFISSIKV